jgi:CSLREA domain-containing protein
MKNSLLNSILLIMLFLSASAVTNVNAQGGRLFTVNHNGDTNDVNVGDGVCADANEKCTLRAAIQEANADTFQDGINFALPLPATISLTLGELSITTNIYIAGPGARKLTVQRSPALGTSDFRIFSIQYTVNSPIPPTIRGLTIKNGKATNDGGAIYINYQTSVQISDATITNNTAGGSGGAIFNAGILNLQRSLISSNTAAGLFAGGIVNVGLATSIIANSTLTNNTGSQGGAIYNSGSLLLVNNTISHNSASVAGSSVMNGSTGAINVMNTIIGMDTSATVSSLSGAFNSLGNNLITDARNSTGFTNGANGDQVSDNNAINPFLGNLTDNGGQTDTRALLTGSPAIDAGNNCVYNGNCLMPIPQGFRLSTDQRINYLRRGGAVVDIGAYESQSFTFNSNLGLGGIGNRNRSGGTLLILTKASTNEKQGRITNPFGNFRFNNLQFGEVYFLERRPKRSQERRGLTVFAFDNLPIPIPFAEMRDIEINFSEKDFDEK